MNQIRWDKCPPLTMPLIKFQICSKFLPLMKKTLMGGIGADAKTSISSVVIKYSAPLLNVMPQGKILLMEQPFFLKLKSFPNEKILNSPLLPSLDRKIISLCFQNLGNFM